MERLAHLALNEEGFVFDPTTGESFVVNHTARIILLGLKDGTFPADIAACLADTFEVGRKEAEEDVVDFTEKLKTYGLK